MKNILYTTKSPKPIGPYSQGVIINNFLYVSGQISIDPKTQKIINQDIESETRQVMMNLEGILIKAKINFEHVIKTSLFVTNINNIYIINRIYSEYFKNTNYPARETIEVSRLPKNVNIEISLIASLII